MSTYFSTYLSKGEITIHKETFFLAASTAVKIKGTTIQPGDKVRLYLHTDWDSEATSKPQDWQLAIADDHFYANDAILPFVTDIAVLGRAKR